MLPHERLLEWFLLEDRTQQLDQFLLVFAADAELDGELILVNRVLPMLEHYAALEEVRPVIAQSDAKSGAVVIEARDPITDLWHRLAWVFLVRDGLIWKVISTRSQAMQRRGEPRSPMPVSLNG